jgi:hypothetical protein
MNPKAAKKANNLVKALPLPPAFVTQNTPAKSDLSAN